MSDGDYRVVLARAVCLVKVRGGRVMFAAPYLWRWRGKPVTQVSKQGTWERLP